MIGSAVFRGGLAALIVIACRLFYAHYDPHFSPLLNENIQRGLFYAPLLVCLVGVSGLGHRFLKAEVREDGFTDLWIQIYSPMKQAASQAVSSSFMRFIFSLLLSSFGVIVGAEGAAIELNQILAKLTRPHSWRWFEWNRRSSAFVSVAAGISASFNAPFTGILLPLELGLGGNMVEAVVASVTAFLGVQFLSTCFLLETLDFKGVLTGFYSVPFIPSWTSLAGVDLVWALGKGLLGTIGMGVGGAVLGSCVLSFIRSSQKGMDHFFQNRLWLKSISALLICCLLNRIYSAGYAPSGLLLEKVLCLKIPVKEVTLLFISQLLSLTWLWIGFGTAGMIWPLFALGGFFGFCFYEWFLSSCLDSAMVASLVGGATFLGAILGAPLAGAVLVFELTQNLQILLPALISALLAKEVCRVLKVETLIQQNLNAKGMQRFEGRLLSVLNALTVEEAMVKDFEVLYHHQIVSEITSQTMQSAYPVFPVVDEQKIYQGLLTLDMISIESSLSPWINLIQVKELLNRSGLKSRPVKLTDPLTVTLDVFKDFPCVAVVQENGTVVGLLFSYAVRMAYDREMSKRSLHFS